VVGLGLFASVTPSPVDRISACSGTADGIECANFWSPAPLRGCSSRGLQGVPTRCGSAWSLHPSAATSVSRPTVLAVGPGERHLLAV